MPSDGVIMMSIDASVIPILAERLTLLDERFFVALELPLSGQYEYKVLSL